MSKSGKFKKVFKEEGWSARNLKRGPASIQRDRDPVDDWKDEDPAGELEMTYNEWEELRKSDPKKYKKMTGLDPKIEETAMFFGEDDPTKEPEDKEDEESVEDRLTRYRGMADAARGVGATLDADEYERMADSLTKKKNESVNESELPLNDLLSYMFD